MTVRDYKVRIAIVFIFFATLFVVIAVRLFLLQIKQKNFFKLLAEQQYELQVKMTPPRGVIVDASKKYPMAFNRHVTSAFIVPSALSESSKTLKMLKKRYPEVYARYRKNPDKHFLWLSRRMSDKELQFLQKLNDPQIHLVDEFARYYPYQGGAQLLGLTDIDNTGIAGLELSFTKQLGGVSKAVKLERDARSGAFYFDRLVTHMGRPGKKLALTVDRYLQEMVAYELQKKVVELKAKSGAAVVLDPETGAVLAMANYPAFDPNQKGVTAFEAMKNRSVSECYEFGSVLKAFCAMAALEERVVSFDEPIDCEGRFGYIDGVKIENPTISLLRRLEEHNNILPFNEVVRYSSNVGIAKIAKRLGPKYYEHLRRLGFGTKTGVQFPGERSGFVNPPERWSKPSLIVMSFGYEIMATLMQLARAFCIVANGGYDVHPTMVSAEGAAKGQKLYRDDTIEHMKCIMEKVAERHQIPGVRVMGKTGTARCIVNGKYSNQLHHYSFGGIVEKDGYRRVILTFVKEPEKASLWASDVALPLFKTAAQRMLVHDKLHHHPALV